jgi:hypothetical protein
MGVVHLEDIAERHVFKGESYCRKLTLRSGKAGEGTPNKHFLKDGFVLIPA